jgi:hypothetical protein
VSASFMYARAGITIAHPSRERLLMYNSASITKVRDKWELSRLKKHPEQDNMFAPPSAQELSRLADDISRNGVRDDIEVLEDGTIVRGHSRLLAAAKAGLSKVPVLILKGLAEQGEDAVLQAMVEDNLHRRHLSPLEIAKCAVVMLSSGISKANGESMSRGIGERGYEIAKQFGISTKTLKRYILVTKTAAVVQHAVSKGYLSMDVAMQVAKLAEDDQLAVAEIIQGLMKEERLGSKLAKHMKAAVLKHLGERHKKRQAYCPVSLVAVAIKKAQATFEDESQFASARSNYWLERRELFVEGAKLLKRLVAEMDAFGKSRQAA